MPWQTTRPSLLVRLRDAGDHRSWMEFDRCYGELIVRYGLRRGLQLTDAEDVRQDVLVSLAGALRTFEYSPERGRFRGYLGRIVHNAISRHATRPHRIRETLVGDDGLDRPAPPAERDSAWEDEWRNHHLRRALREVRRRFEPKSIEAFQMFLNGETTESVCEATGLSAEAAHKVKQRLRDRLRDVVRKQLDEEEGHRWT
jgi:RNA polymerase sigma-70 factor (ECF subfamily)